MNPTTVAPPRPKRVKHPGHQAEVVTLPDESSAVICPPDDMALAHWLGTSAKNLWYLVLHRKALYKEYHIKKPGGGVRVLHDPGVKLKFFQNMALKRILEKLPSPAHFGVYVEERGTMYTSHRHAGHAVILELDIKNFFGSTSRGMVRHFLYSLGWAEKPAKLLADLLTYPIRPTKSIVPQGAPTSPMLCNHIADQRFDQAVLAYLATKTGWVYTRYSDNLFISHPVAQTKEEVSSVLTEVRKLIEAGGFRVNNKKVKVLRQRHPKRAQHMLGLTVNVHPNIPSQVYRRLRAQVHTAATQGFGAVKGLPKAMTPAQVPAHLRGVLTYYSYVHPHPKLERLKQRLVEAEAKKKLGESL